MASFYGTGRFGDCFYQRCRNGVICKKSRLIKWKSVDDPSDRQLACRLILANVVRAHKYSNRKEMYEQIKNAFKGEC